MRFSVHVRSSRHVTHRDHFVWIAYVYRLNEEIGNARKQRRLTTGDGKDWIFAALGLAHEEALREAERWIKLHGQADYVMSEPT